jgi:hypothetical protein
MTLIEHDLRRSVHEQLWGDWFLAERNPFPRFTPFPTVNRLEQQWKQARRQVREARSRVGQAIDILRYGYTEEDEW